MFPIKDNIPTDNFPIVTVALIVINVVVFLFWQHPMGFNGVDNTKVVEYGAIPYELTHPGKHCDTVGNDQIACEGQRGVTGIAKLVLGAAPQAAPFQCPAACFDSFLRKSTSARSLTGTWRRLE